MYARKALKKLPQHTDSTLELTLAENVLKCCDALAADNDSKLDELKLRFKEMIPSSGTSQVSGTSGGMHSSTIDAAPPTGSLQRLSTIKRLKDMPSLVHTRITDKSDYKTLRQELVTTLAPVKDLQKSMDGRFTTVSARLTSFAKNPLKSPAAPAASGKEGQKEAPVLSLSGEKVRAIMKRDLPSLSLVKSFNEPLVINLGPDLLDCLKTQIDIFTDRFDKEVISKTKPGAGGSRGQDPCSDENVRLISTALGKILNPDFVKQAVFCRGDVGADPPGFKEFMRSFLFGITAGCSTCACEAGYAGQLRLCFKGSRKISLMDFGKVLAELRGGGGLPKAGVVTLKDARQWFQNLTQES